MLRACFITLFMICAAQLSAQGWTAEVTRDAIYDAGHVAMPGGMMAIACAAPTGRGSVTPDSRWWEVSVAPPWQYLVAFADPIVPVAPGQYETDMILFADDTGYKLPLVSLNELEGGWQVMLSMSDPVFTAAAGASRLILQVGTVAAWELPVAGLAAGLKEISAACVSGWQARGIANPQQVPANIPAQGPLDMQAAARNAAALTCDGVVNIGPSGVQTANIDGDGHADVILDYNDITCGPQRLRPNVCGASTCSIDVFLSGSFAVSGRAENLLGSSAAVVQLSNGNMAVSASGNLSMCQSTAPCAFLFYWDGARFTDLKQ